MDMDWKRKCVESIFKFGLDCGTLKLNRMGSWNKE